MAMQSAVSTPLAMHSNLFDRLSNDNKARLRALASWDLDHVGTTLRQSKAVDAPGIRLLEREYRKFIGLIVLYPDIPFGMLGAVDTFWHAHILFTRDYVAFSSTVKGQYIHHTPHIDRDSPDYSYADYTVPYLQNVYGRLETLVWPVPQYAGLAKCGKDCGCRVGIQVKTNL